MLAYSQKAEMKLEQSRSIDRSHLIRIDKKYALMNQSTRRQVTSQLQEELDYLLGKKEREQMKRKKLRELQQIYEKERSNRISRINLKISRSDKNREMSLKEKRTRTKKNLDYVDAVRKKNQHENEEELEKKLELQKSFSKLRTDSRSSHSSLNQKESRSNLSFHRRMNSDTEDVSYKIQNIEFKLDQAKTNSQFYYSQIAQRAKGYGKNFDEIMDKIKSQSVMDQSKCIREYYKRATHIAECGQKSKDFFQRQSQRKKKVIEQKFQRAKQNLRELDRVRENKMQQLQLKFNKSFAPKSWKNEKNQTYLQKFMKNQKQIQFEKTIKAEIILQKHFDLSLKNRVLREKKDKIIQTVKRVQK